MVAKKEKKKKRMPQSTNEYKLGRHVELFREMANLFIMKINTQV